MKSYLAQVTDKMTYCEQVADKEALSTLKEGLNMSTLVKRDVQNKNPITYDTLVEMMRSEIVNKELIDHRNRISMGLPPPQRER